MATLAPTTPSAARPAPSKTDGRRERSASSRRRILSAMVDLIEQGEPSPTAESIAYHAGVSLRTVFRHFEEMDNLHTEIAALIFARVRPLLEEPVVSKSWPAIMAEAIERRTAFFEAMLPFKAALDVNRYRSELLATKHQEMDQLSQELLLDMLPEHVRADSQLTGMLVLLLSSESWHRLRVLQKLDRAQATSLLQRATYSLLGIPLKG